MPDKPAYIYGPRMVEVYEVRHEDREDVYIWLGYSDTKPAGAVWNDEMKAWVVDPPPDDTLE